ncbi:hypothetical protein GGR56DRAFT_661623 [Xylariaceae sp. FL0804]|nr:hypothetical protein GGR56DRAFT_661623 [Xylariaceae sp. FL0804]
MPRKTWSLTSGAISQVSITSLPSVGKHGGELLLPGKCPLTDTHLSYNRSDMPPRSRSVSSVRPGADKLSREQLIDRLNTMGLVPDIDIDRRAGAQRFIPRHFAPNKVSDGLARAMMTLVEACDDRDVDRASIWCDDDNNNKHGHERGVLVPLMRNQRRFSGVQTTYLRLQIVNEGTRLVLGMPREQQQEPGVGGAEELAWEPRQQEQQQEQLQPQQQQPNLDGDRQQACEPREEQQQQGLEDRVPWAQVLQQQQQQPRPGLVGDGQQAGRQAPAPQQRAIVDDSLPDTTVLLCELLLALYIVSEYLF